MQELAAKSIIHDDHLFNLDASSENLNLNLQLLNRSNSYNSERIDEIEELIKDMQSKMELLGGADLDSLTKLLEKYASKDDLNDLL